MVQLGIAREGEVIGDEALAAYIDIFSKPMTQQQIAACLALFGWTPETSPLVDDVETTVVV
jgi:hypothetical protein